MEMPLRVYTKYLDLICEVDSYSSAQLERNYHDVGNAEIHINHHVHGAESIKKGNIITLGDSPDKAMFVRHMEIELTEGGKQSEEWTIKGPTLQGLMNQRITVPPKGSGYDRKSGAAETVMKHYVRQNFIDAANNKRVMKELLIAPDKERGEHVSHESRYKNVSDELANISKESGLGWIVYIDYTRHKFVFDVVDGLNLEQNNEEGYDPVFFSPDFGTIKSQSFSDSDLDMANHGYIAGQGEGKDRKVIEIGDKTGMNRFETFVDARDVGTEDDEDEEELTEEEIEKMLIDRGNKKMKELENELSLEAEILSPTTREAYQWKHDGYLQPIQPHGHYERKEQQITPFVYERDFDLGDTVPVYNRKWGITMTARITKIKEIHEPGGFRLEATFGKERPTLVSKIRDNFNELNGIETQEVPAQLIKKESKLRDEKLTQEKLDRIKQAQKNLDEARGYTQDYAEKKVHVGAEPPEDTDQKWLDTSGSHDKWRRYNHDASDNDTIDIKWPTTDVIDKDTTFANEWLVARHIESLNGLSVANGQLQITEDGNLKTSGDITGATGILGDGKVIIDNQGIKILRPDGAVWMENGLTKTDYNVSGFDPHYMTTAKWNDFGGASVQGEGFRIGGFKPSTSAHFYGGIKGRLDGREYEGTQFKDSRDPMNCVAFQRYRFNHSARYLVFGFRKNSGAKFSVHIMNDGSADIDDRIFYRLFEKDYQGYELLIADLGKPTYESRMVGFKIGWTNGWGAADEEMIFKVESVYLTDEI